MKIWQKVIIAIILGSLFGYAFNANSPLGFDGKTYLDSYLKPFGNTFMDLIKLMVVPLIFFALVTGITSTSDGEAFKRIGKKAIIVFLSTAIVAVLLGIAFGTVFEPGKGVNLSELIKNTGVAKKTETPKEYGLGQILHDIIPSNVIGAMATNDHLVQVVFFAIVFGITVGSFGDKMQPIKEICQLGALVFFKLIGGVMKLAPYGVFALIAPMVASQGVQILKDLAYLVLTVCAALGVQFALFGVILAVFGRLSPAPFYRKMVEIQIVAFSTSSSKATLPTAMRILQEKMGVSKLSTEFLLPLAASVNMVGISIYISICTLFVSQALHISLSLGQYFLLMFTATLGAIGGAGFPGGSIVMMGMVFGALGIPAEGIAVILGIDRILDMLRTVINLSCDCMMTLLIDKSEGTLDEKAYYNMNL